MHESILADQSFTVYGAWMHPELKEIGWDTVLKKNQIYNNCESRECMVLGAGVFAD